MRHGVAFRQTIVRGVRRESRYCTGNLSVAEIATITKVGAAIISASTDNQSSQAKGTPVRRSQGVIARDSR